MVVEYFLLAEVKNKPYIFAVCGHTTFQANVHITVYTREMDTTRFLIHDDLTHIAVDYTAACSTKAKALACA